ncbi:unnamed protein product [Closterium sp. Yama58-4]|nr:unnamed protein product [Closterium sp. Yama58-4]
MTSSGQQKKFPAFCPEIPDELEMTRVVPAQCAEAVLKMKRFWEEQGEWPESLQVEIPDPGSPKEWSGQIFRLRNVFVNWRGQVFNQTHLFDAGRCGDRLADFDYPSGTRFAAFPALLNLLSAARSPADVVFSEMTEKLPLFLSLAPVMPLLRHTPLVRGIWQAVVGLRPSASAVHAMAHSSLLFARTLYIVSSAVHAMAHSSPLFARTLHMPPLPILAPHPFPLFLLQPLFPPCGHPSPLSCMPSVSSPPPACPSSLKTAPTAFPLPPSPPHFPSPPPLPLPQPLFPPCGHPSPSLLHAFRARHLFPPSGLPLFSQDGSYRAPAPGSLAEQGAEEEAGELPEGPMGSMGPMGHTDGRLKHDWVVVVAAPPSRLPTVQAVALAAALRAVKWILKQLYTEDRVAVYRRNMPLQEARALFQRALLFVACDNALVNTLFMPSHSSVIEIRTSTSSSGADSVYPDGGRQLYRNLALAAAVRHYLLECPEEPVVEATDAGAESGGDRWGEVGSGGGGSDGDASAGAGGASGVAWEDTEEEDGEKGGGSSVYLPRGSLACGVERLRTVLESVLHNVFASESFDPNLLDRSGEGFRTKIPGSKVSRADLKERFLKWQECVAAEGSWKFDPRPRRLPWEFKGYSNYCDKRHMAASPTAVVVSKADQIADSIMKLPPEERKVRQEEWDVRPQLKYVWDTEGKCGAWEPFDGRVVCDWVRGRRWNGTGMPLTEEEEEEREEAAFKGEAVREKGDGSGALVLLIGDSYRSSLCACCELIEPDHARHSFCRDYKLHGNVCANLTIRFIRHDYLQLSNSQIKFDRVPFTRLSLLTGARVIILNRGAHYRPDRHFISAVRSTLRFLRNKLPDAILIYRTTVQGHANCSEHDKPLLVPGPTDNLPFFWGRFHEQNELARAAVEEVGGMYLDVAAMTVLRPDSHQGFIPELNHEDCLHYCIPGPQDVWAQLLQNVLLQLLPEPAPAAALGGCGEGLGGCGEELGGCGEELGGCGEELGGCGEELGGCGEELGGCGEELGGCGEELGGCGEELGGCGEELGGCGEELGGCVEDLGGCGEELGGCGEGLGGCGEELGDFDVRLACCDVELAGCGGELEGCCGELAGCGGGLAGCGGELAGCGGGLAGCGGELAGCGGGLAGCDSGLEGCGWKVEGCGGKVGALGLTQGPPWCSS